MKKKQEKEALQIESINILRKTIKAGDTIYTSLNHVSASGMSRDISVLIPIQRDNGELAIRDITYYVHRILDMPMGKHGGVRVGGCGMDMGYHIVYSLSRALFREDFMCIGENCPSNDHTNDRDGTWNRTESKGKKHSDGGYALSHKWI